MLFEHRYAADAAQSMQRAVDDREPGRIVTTVLQAAQAFDQD